MYIIQFILILSHTYINIYTYVRMCLLTTPMRAQCVINLQILDSHTHLDHILE